MKNNATAKILAIMKEHLDKNVPEYLGLTHEQKLATLNFAEFAFEEIAVLNSYNLSYPEADNLLLEKNIKYKFQESLYALVEARADKRELSLEESYYNFLQSFPVAFHIPSNNPFFMVYNYNPALEIGLLKQRYYQNNEA